MRAPTILAVIKSTYNTDLPSCLNRPAFVLLKVLPVLALDDDALTDRERRHFSKLDKI